MPAFSVYSYSSDRPPLQVVTMQPRHAQLNRKPRVIPRSATRARHLKIDEKQLEISWCGSEKVSSKKLKKDPHDFECFVALFAHSVRIIVRVR